METLAEVLDEIGDVEVSMHGQEESYFEPTAARCSSSSSTCCCK